MASSDQETMERLVSQWSPENLSAFKNEYGNFHHLEDWPGVKLHENSLTVQAIDWSVYCGDTRSKRQGKILLEYIPESVEEFRINNREFEGDLICDQLPQNIRVFCAGGNRLSGTPVLSDLPINLEIFEVPHNFLSGNISIEGIPTALECINLFGNRLTGSIQLCQSSQGLKYLLLGRNQLNGSVHLGSLPAGIKRFCCEENQIEGSISLSSLPNSIEELNMYENRLSGEITLDGLPSNLRVLSLSENSLSGPVNLQKLPESLEYLFLDGNSFHGSVSLDRLPPNMHKLHLNDNFFDVSEVSGTPPESLIDLQIDNKKDPTIPVTTELLTTQERMERVIAGWSTKNKRMLLDERGRMLDVFHWHGVITNEKYQITHIDWGIEEPAKKGHQGSIALEWLPETLEEFDIDNRGFEGEIDWKRLPPKIREFRVGGNALSGEIFLEDAPQTLQVLHLHENHFLGNINFQSLPKNLQSLYLNGNRFCGDVCLDKLPKTLLKLHLQDNSFDGSLVLGKPLLNCELLLENNPFSEAAGVVMENGNRDASQRGPSPSRPSIPETYQPPAKPRSRRPVGKRGATNQKCMERVVAGLSPTITNIFKDRSGKFCQLKDWKGVTLYSNKSVKRIDWKDLPRSISGPNRIALEWIPDSVEFIDISSMGVGGALDLSLLPRSLTNFQAIRNRLSGDLSFEHAPKGLKTLNISKNCLSGTLETLPAANLLTSLIVDTNRLHGGIDLTRLPQALIHLACSNNRLSGPLDLTCLPPKLKYLNVSSNDFTRPESLENLPKDLKFKFFENDDHKNTNISKPEITKVPSPPSKIQKVEKPSPKPASTPQKHTSVEGNSQSSRNRMMKLISGLHRRIQDTFKDRRGRYTHLKTWEGVTMNPDGTVKEIDWYQPFPSTAGDEGTINLQWIPDSVERFVITNCGFEGTLDVKKLPGNLKRFEATGNRLKGAITKSELPKSIEVFDVDVSCLPDDTDLPSPIETPPVEFLDIPEMARLSGAGKTDMSLETPKTCHVSDQESMERLVQDFGDTAKQIFMKNAEEFFDLSQWPGITMKGETVIAIDWDGNQNEKLADAGRIHFEHLPASVETVSITNCGLTGEINTQKLPRSLRMLTISGNRLSGNISLEGLPQALETLKISHNRFSGVLSFQHLPITLKDLFLDNNEFQGDVDLSRVPKSLENLNVSSNRFDGRLMLGSAMDHLKDLRVDGNPLKKEVWKVYTVDDDMWDGNCKAKVLKLG